MQTYHHENLMNMWPRKTLINFVPSRRKIEFLQKNIRLFNVELIETNVFDHKRNNIKNWSFTALVPNLKRKNENKTYGAEQTK
jgi:hypothetical protein